MSGLPATADPSPRHARRRRVLRPWRWALLIFGVALAVATHWPRLRLSPEIPASDKTIHMLSFACLTLLLWRSDLFGPRWMVAIIALAWSTLDEVSQGIPFLHRTVTWHDLVANACGVTCAMALIWAMRPLRQSEHFAGPNETRARLFEFTFDEMFARRQPWIIGLAMALACAIVILIARPLLPSQRTVGIFGLVVVIIAVHALYLIYRRIFFRDFDRIRAQRPCLKCGAPRGTAVNSNEAESKCAACGAVPAAADYALPPRPSLAVVVRISIVPALVAVAAIAALFALVLLVPHTYGWMIGTPVGRTAAPRLAQLFGRLPRSVASVVDLTTYTLLIAVVVRIWRRRYAAYIDRAVRCTRCGHDLHGTPVDEHGEGHCGECGEPFVRPVTPHA